MGVILKFIIFTLGTFTLLSLLLGATTMRFILRLIFKGRKTQNRNHHTQQEPVSQSDRIITYKKKEFETTAAEDVEFEEIKEKD